MNRPTITFGISRAILILVGLLLIGFGVSILRQRQADYASGGFLIIFGLCLAVTGVASAVTVFSGKALVDETVTLSLPGNAGLELLVPCKLPKGKIVIFFEETVERYSGRISLTKIPTGKSQTVFTNLPKLEPSRIKVPKWLPTSDAGGVVENWPRRTGQLTDPIILEFSFGIEPRDKLMIEFLLESNFKGTKLEERFPVTGKETIRAILKR